MDYEKIDLKGFSMEKQLAMSTAFPTLLRKVYVWMT